MTTTNATNARNRRHWLGLALGAGLLPLLPACSAQTSFNGIDITGADYASDFDLPDQHGRQRTLADFRGKVVVIFFGYTQCPDVCPTSMIEMAEARRLLGADGERLQGIFISVDPERDTPEIMREYMDSFDPSFLALHVSAEALPELAKRFRIVYQKVEGPTPTSYTMDHSAGSYVYDTQGRVRLYERYGSGAQALADDVKKLLSEG
ncbi:MAG: SCO family protein [Hydrogenophaga sp.]|jgi:protein SCO1/2|uniref:SCO family protein n=1 Tax=Hydrogenophaga sp. TaxID=1904254 RepID=UPI000EDAF0B1|nr:SCO family protein [Hydrogenophaga sp.]MDD3784657.1 SCO family protein [Hydrogenophaga sp.]MDX9968755.1 SCO family protein [Hydrogenophaga sp.]HAJ13013.1 SCO family protein [Comamonadaceae bacterium]